MGTSVLVVLLCSFYFAETVQRSNWPLAIRAGSRRGGLETSGQRRIITDRCAIHPATYCVEVAVFSHDLINTLERFYKDRPACKTQQDGFQLTSSEITLDKTVKKQ